MALHRAILVPGGAGLLFLLHIGLAMAALAAIGGWLAGLLGLPALAGALLALPLGLFAKSLWRVLDQHFNVCWLIRAFGYLLDHANRRLDEDMLAERHRVFAERLIEVTEGWCPRRGPRHWP